MKRWWLELAQKIDKLARRERVMVFGAALAIVGYLIFALAIDPAQQRGRALHTQIEQQREELATLQKLQPVLSRGANGPAAAAPARREAVTRQIGDADEALKAMHKSLVPAQRVNLLLQEMLKGEGGLQLVSLRTLPAAPLLPEVQKPASPPAAATRPAPKRDFVQNNVYKHGVEITLRGGYADLYQYLARLERSQWRMFWSRARLSVDEHPRLTLTLTIYTLSLDKAWLEV